MIAGTLEIQMMANMVRLQKDMDDAKRAVGGAMADIEKAVGFAKTAFVALAGVASVGAFVGMIRGAIDAAERLKDLSAQTGATVGALSALAEVGNLSETSVDSIAGAMNKLSKSMAVANEESKGSAAAVRALGLDLATFKNLVPEEQMLAVAKAMDQFADGGGKSAIAMALYGKEGARLIPLLKDLAIIGELHGKVTAAQAETADNFNDNLVRINISGNEWKRQVAMGILPVMSDLSDAWLKAMNGTGGLRAEVKKLSDDGTLAEWARMAVRALTYLMDIGQALFSLLPLLGKAIAGAVAATSVGFSAIYEAFDAVKRGDLTGAWEALKRGAEGVQVVAKEAAVDVSNIWNQELLGEKIRKGMAEAKTAREAAGVSSAKPQADFDDTRAAAVAKEASEYDKLIKAIREKAAVEEAEGEAGNALTESEKLALRVMIAIRDTKKEITTAEKQGIAAELEALLAKEKANDAQKEAAKALAEYGKAVDALLKPLEDEARSLETQAENYGKTRAQIELTAIARLKEAASIAAANGANKDAIDFYEREIAARQRIADAAGKNDALQQQTDVWKSIENTAHQTFVSIFDSGKSAFDRLRDTLKNGLLDLLYQMTVKKWLISISAGVSGEAVAGALGREAGGSGGLGTAANGLSLTNSIFGGSGSLFTSLGASSLFGNTAFGGGLTLAGSEGIFGGFSAGLELLSTGGSSMSALGAMLPGIGTAIAAISLIASLMGKGGGPKTGGDAYLSYSGDTPSAMNGAQLAQLLPNLGGNSAGVGFYTPDNGNATASQLLAASGAGVASTIKALGGSMDGLMLGLGYDTDPSGTASSRVHGGVYRADGSAVYDQESEVGRDSDMTAAMTLEMQRVTLAAIKAADGIKPFYAAIAAGVDLTTATAEQLTAAMQHLADAKSLMDFSQSDPFSDYAQSAKAAAQTLIETWREQRGALDGLLSAFDGSAAATTQLATLTKARYAQELQLAQQIEQTRSGFGASTDSSIRDYRMSVLDNQGKYGYLDKEAADLLEQIKATTDPSKIGTLSASLQADRNAAWNLLDDSQKKANLDEFVQRAEDDRAVVNQQLDRAADVVKAGHQELADALVAAMSKGADALVAAANQIAVASAAPVQVVVTASQFGAGNEVSVAGG